MNLHDTIRVSGISGMPSLGSLLGTRVSQDVFDAINANNHVSFFGKDFDNLSQEFFDRYIAPLDKLNLELSKTVNAVLNPDRIRLLSSFEDFKSIPLSMEMAILMFEPVLEKVRAGKFGSFGYDIDTLPVEDIHGRLIDNFSCHDVEAASDDEGYYTIKAKMFSDDPDYTDDELWDIERTRNWLRAKLLRDDSFNPIDPLEGVG